MRDPKEIWKQIENDWYDTCRSPTPQEEPTSMGDSLLSWEDIAELDELEQSESQQRDQTQAPATQ